MLSFGLFHPVTMRRCLLGAAMALTVSVSVLASASPALATTHHPKGEYAPYFDCPLSTPGLAGCVLAETTSGKFVVGKREVPINKTITLTGGFTVNEETGATKFVGAEDGNTLSKVALYVPGGLLDIVAPEWLNEKQKKEFEETINKGLTGVTETTELAGPASNIVLNTENLIERRGTALLLPIKIKLGNVFLGSTCYVGSNKAPINLNLTSGVTEPPKGVAPIEGEVGALEINESFTIITLNGGKLVNNTFAAPEAEGCGEPLSFLVNKAVDAALDLPSASGKNEAILQGKLSTASAPAVLASE